ncbi:hypothetical protein LIER_15375 [Lithospermum erythrorhizon]|uniref:Uncharacterized protein n=1 Tax=Lithospermum erythrorhizon TaxID=34254 RepID=A0AAV3Q7V6_LITER
MVSSLEGIQTAEGLRELLWSSEAGEELLIQSSNQAMTRIIQVVQDKLEVASLDIPTTLWESMRDEVPPPDPSAP